MTTTRPLPNPFTPAFGFVPSYLAGREKVVNNLTRALQVGPRNPDLSSILMGAHGTGKPSYFPFSQTRPRHTVGLQATSPHARACSKR